VWRAAASANFAFALRAPSTVNATPRSSNFDGLGLLMAGGAIRRTHDRNIPASSHCYEPSMAYENERLATKKEVLATLTRTSDLH